MSFGLALAAGLIGGVAALLATPLLIRIAGGESGWLRWRAHIPLAVCGIVGSATLATRPVEMLAFSVAALACALLVVLDLAAHRLPDVIVGPAVMAVVALLVLAAVLDDRPGRLGRSLLAGAMLFMLYYGLALLRRSGLGFGDVKLAGFLGVFLGWLGWPQVLVGTVAAFALGGMWAAVLLLSRRSGRGDSYPYGPWMVLGAAVGAAWGAVAG